MDTLKKWVFYLPYLNMSLKQGSPKLLLLMDKYWKILRALDINKARGHDEISIRTLKLCDNLSLHPYPYCSRIVLIQGLSRTLERSQILCLFTKKGDKDKVDNYRPVSLLSILGKKFWNCCFQFNFWISWRE